MLSVTIIFILFLLFDAVEGIREAIFWKYGYNMPKKHNKVLHGFFLITRTIVGLIALVPINYVYCSYITAIGFTIASVLSFPFIHDGFYYLTRDLMDKGTYPKRFMDMSNTSQAWSTKYFTPNTRLLLFINGIIAFILTLVYIYYGIN